MSINIPAGPELDSLVIRHVLEVPVFRFHREAEERWGDSYTSQTYALFELGERHVIHSPAGGAPFQPSTDIAAAWQVMEALNPDKFTRSTVGGRRLIVLAWDCGPNAFAFGDTDAHGICLAAANLIDQYGILQALREAVGYQPHKEG